MAADCAAKPCKYWHPHEGSGCRDGARCRFLHAAPSQVPCKYFAAGSCTSGKACRFAHQILSSSVVHGTLIPAARWEHGARGSWLPCSEAVASVLEVAHCGREPSVKFEVGGEAYEADLVAMKQQCLKHPERQRRLRRVDADAAESSFHGGADIDKWEAKVNEAQSLFDTSLGMDTVQAMKTLTVADALLTDAAEGLDCLKLAGDLRERRRSLLQRIDTLGVEVAAKKCKKGSSVGDEDVRPIGSPEADSAMTECEAQIAEARSHLEGLGSATDTRRVCLLVDDLLFKIAEKLDCLKLDGAQRERRRGLLQQVEMLGAEMAEKRARGESSLAIRDAGS